MNSCILMAEVIQEPQLRYTADHQIPLTEMLVEFPSGKPDDPPATLKVVAWRDLAQEIQKRCKLGDRVIIEGSLNMNLIDRPEGFREKRAELTAQRIYSLGTKEVEAMNSTPGTTSDTPQAPGNVVSLEGRRSTADTSSGKPSTPPEPEPPEDYDPIPF